MFKFWLYKTNFNCIKLFAYFMNNQINLDMFDSLDIFDNFDNFDSLDILGILFTVYFKLKPTSVVTNSNLTQRALLYRESIQ